MNFQLTLADRIAIERSLAEELTEFLQMAWHVVDPGTPYVHNWHMDAICEHLEAVARQEITRLIINVPPGTSKSSATSVYFPAWLWGPFNKKHMRFIGASHELSLATRDNRKCRNLIQSDWYQQRWPIKLQTDQNEKTSFENDKTGWRQACAVKSMTGKRGDVVVWDDPQSPEKAYSDADRETANRVFDETLPTRLNDPERSGIIIIQQRLHEDDVTGHILAKDLGYEHLCLPMEFEPERKCYTSIGFEDPRTEDGELLMEERFPKRVVERDKKVMGSFAVAGQFQQRPVPRGGAMFKRDDLEIIPAAPAGTRWVRGWDLAASVEKTSAWTAGVLVGISPEGRTIIGDARRIQGTAGQVVKLLKNTASQDTAKVKGSLPQDPGQAGKAQAQYLLKKLVGYSYTASVESGDKVTRAEPLAAQVEAGNVDIVQGGWNEDFIAELTAFPFGKFKDQVDAATRAFAELTQGSNYRIIGAL